MNLARLDKFDSVTRGCGGDAQKLLVSHDGVANMRATFSGVRPPTYVVTINSAQSATAPPRGSVAPSPTTLSQTIIALREHPYVRAGLNAADGAFTCAPVAQIHGLPFSSPSRFAA